MSDASAYVFPPAAASPKEVLELEPNNAAPEGPHPPVSPTTYVRLTTPAGRELLSPLSNVETYERKGFTRGAEVEIPDLVAYLAEQARKEPAQAQATPKPKAADKPAEKR